jgi:hypothetical protein
MAAASSLSSSSSLGHFISNPHRPSTPSAFAISVRSPLPSRLPSFSSLRLRLPPLPSLSNGSGNNGGKSNGSGNQGGGGGDDEDDESGWEENRDQALFVLANLGRSLDSLPLDLAEAVRDGKVTGEIITRFVNLEKSPLFRWLMNFGGFKERLLADDLFLAKVLMECGVGIFTKAMHFFSPSLISFY